MFEQSKKIDITVLLQAMESADSNSVEQLREKINNDAALKKELAIEVGRLFLSCIAMSEVFDLKVDQFMNECSPEELANLLGDNDCDNDCDCCEETDADEDDCCGSC